MSKYVKDLITREVADRLQGVDECVLVDVIGLDANQTVTLRRRLREKDISLLVVKNSLARRATAGTPLSAAFEGLTGSSAVCWGSEDFISLAKEVTELDKDVDFEEFSAKGGVMDGDRLSRDRVLEISKWPSRTEQLSILSGQILSVGAALSSQLLAPGRLLASQIKKKSEESDAS